MTLNVCSHLIIAAVPLFPSRPFPLPLLSSPLRQLLIAADDWSTHAQGGPGTTRYRIANLPSQTGPGVYELGVLPNRVVRRQRRLQGLPVRVVYVGHSESVRSRMQQYGQSGSHLKELFEGVFAEDYSLTFRWTSVSRGMQQYGQSGSHLKELFEGVFAEDYPLIFRWTPAATKAEAAATETLLLSALDYIWNAATKAEAAATETLLLSSFDYVWNAATKAEAAATETLLLSSFDYVWNVCNNHHRRHDRLLTKLQVGSSFSRRAAVAFPFLPVARLVTPVAVPLKVPQQVAQEQVSARCAGDVGVVTCGAPLVGGGTCQEAAVKGRVRCAAHKRIRVKGRGGM
ncbi:unnamed protein product [Closterium sp. Naga37s-1]|nr:unnamed protein product [Closterium sp. Naga37s-1]